MDKKVKIVIDINKNGKYFWRLVSTGNNETLAVSESYEAKQNCERTVKMLMEALDISAEDQSPEKDEQN